MNLPPSLAKRYTKETLTAMQAQRAAHEISQGPVVFQVSRLMVKFGILQQLIDSDSRKDEPLGICRQNTDRGFVVYRYGALPRR